MGIDITEQTETFHVPFGSPNSEGTPETSYVDVKAHPEWICRIFHAKSPQMRQDRRPTSVRGNVQKSSSCPERSRRKGRSPFDARSVLSVREHGKRATCLREAASAGMEPLACQP